MNDAITTLSARLLPLITSEPMMSVDLWDRLGDESVRLSDVVDALIDMSDRGVVCRIPAIKGVCPAAQYSLPVAA